MRLPDIRWGPPAAIAGWLLAVWLLGPWLLLLGPAALLVPQVRWWLRPHRPWRVVGGSALALVVTAATITVVPDGWLPIPPGPGVAMVPAYLGGAASPRPVEGYVVPQHPVLAPNGTNGMHNDAWASGSYPWAGPRGDRVEVDTAWFGIEECATLAFDSQARLVALCGDLRGPTMHVIDPGTMRKRATWELPARRSDSGKRPWEDLCAGAYFYLERGDRAVVATTDRRIVVLRTTDDQGDPRLEQVGGHDLTAAIPPEDCLVALLPDPERRIWFVTQQGRVGALDPDTGRVGLHETGEEIANSFAVDNDGGVFVVTDAALYRFDAGPQGGPRVSWRAPYDRGERVKPGQLTRGSGTTPVLLANQMVAITDNAEPRMNVVFHQAASGREICRAPVFEKGRSATENSLIGLGRGVVVENNYGYSSPLSTLFGRTTAPGLARVDVVDGGRCEVAWTSAEVAPTSVPKLSLANGLVYAYTKRSSRWGVSAWYLTALDVRTGRRAFSVRTGTGVLANNHYAAVTIAPDGTLFIATLAGLIRVRDRR